MPNGKDAIKARLEAEKKYYGEFVLRREKNGNKNL